MGVGKLIGRSSWRRPCNSGGGNKVWRPWPLWAQTLSSLSSFGGRGLSFQRDTALSQAWNSFWVCGHLIFRSLEEHAQSSDLWCLHTDCCHIHVLDTLGPQHPGYPVCGPNSPGRVDFSDSHHSMTHWLHGGNFLSGWRDHTFILYLCNPRAHSVISPNKGLKISEEHDLACVITTLSFLVLLWFFFFWTLLPSHNLISFKWRSHSNDLSSKTTILVQAPSSFLWLSNQSQSPLHHSLPFITAYSWLSQPHLGWELSFSLLLWILFIYLMFVHEHHYQSIRDLYRVHHEQLQPCSISKGNHFNSWNWFSGTFTFTSLNSISHAFLTIFGRSFRNNLLISCPGRWGILSPSACIIFSPLPLSFQYSNSW